MQMSLMHETLNDALREVVQAAGCPKKVGADTKALLAMALKIDALQPQIRRAA